MVGKLTVSGLPGVRSELAFMRSEMSVALNGSCVAFALMAVAAMASTGKRTDLAAAIGVSREAVAATPLDHPIEDRDSTGALRAKALCASLLHDGLSIPSSVSR
jgi:hypothetical protein